MKYRLTNAQRERCLALRSQLDTQERERLMKNIEEAGADDAAGFSLTALQARGELYRLESRISRIDQILDQCELLRTEEEEDRLACELAEIKYGNFSGEGALLHVQDTGISMEKREENGQCELQLTLRHGDYRPLYLCLKADKESGGQEYLILSESFWAGPVTEQNTAAHYTSLAQASGSAYLPYLLILYYAWQDSVHTDEYGIPEDEYYLDEDLYHTLAECPPWMPLPADRNALKADPPGKRPMRAAQIPVPEDHVLLRTEYGERFGFAYQILPEGEKEEDDEEILEEYCHLRDILESKYLRYYLMLLETIEPAGAAFYNL